MNNKKNILVFPCGSEIALEIHKSVRYSAHFHLIGASSIDDHGCFVFNSYIGDVPFVDDSKFIPDIAEIVKKYRIDAIYPAMDSVIAVLKTHEVDLGCIVVAPSEKTCLTCLAKSRTYAELSSLIPVPKIFPVDKKDLEFPIFAKPDIGYGSRGAKLISNQSELDDYVAMHNNYILCEYLPGKEYTIDCFTDRHGKLRFCQPRIRNRIANGISVNTHIAQISEAANFAERISSALKMRGAWFFQMKMDSGENPKLLEVAARLGGASALCRARGVNFALLSLYDAFGFDVEIMENHYDVELDRALSNNYKLNFLYGCVFLDFDDCLIINGKLNSELIAFTAKCKNENKPITLLTRYAGDLNEELRRWGLSCFFDSVIHITDGSPKSKFIKGDSPIFIDDSFAERKEVKNSLHIPVFSPDIVECLSNEA